MNTPWGKSDGTTKIERGVSWVNTPGHGGLAITSRVAIRTLSAEALQRADFKGGYYFFEEDCAYAIAFYEKPIWSLTLNPASVTAEEIRTKLLPGISRFYSDYLIARGITPDPDGFSRWQEDQETDRLRAASLLGAEQPQDRRSRSRSSIRTAAQSDLLGRRQSLKPSMTPGP